jgi:hypothetical protein
MSLDFKEPRSRYARATASHRQSYASGVRTFSRSFITTAAGACTACPATASCLLEVDGEATFAPASAPRATA